jgi:hypothetical protein
MCIHVFSYVDIYCARGREYAAHTHTCTLITERAVHKSDISEAYADSLWAYKLRLKLSEEQRTSQNVDFGSDWQLELKERFKSN